MVVLVLVAGLINFKALSLKGLIIMTFTTMVFLFNELQVNNGITNLYQET